MAPRAKQPLHGRATGFEGSYKDQMKPDRRTFTRAVLASGAALLLPRRAFAKDAPGPDGVHMIEPKALGANAAGGLEGRMTYGADDTVRIIRITRGEELKARLVNGLDAPTTIHWRGVRGPNEMDGTGLVQKPVPANGAFDYRFTPPDAGTFIFQPHAEPDFAAQAQRGLAGVLIVADPAGQAVDHDLVAALADRPASTEEIAACARVAQAPVIHAARQMAGAGLAYSVLTANGRPAPGAHELAPGARVRLRLANLATSRLMPLAFEGLAPLVVAVDGQDCPSFAPLRNILPLAPGGRFDVIFDMPDREGARGRIALLGAAAAGAWDGSLLTFTARGAALPARPPVSEPKPNPLLPASIALQKAHRAELVFETSAPAGSTGEAAAICPAQAPAVWRINGKPGESGLRLFAVRRGTPVSLGLTNKSETLVVVRVHGHAMRQLHQFDDGWDPYWRDAVVVPAGRTVRVAFVADNPGRWRIGGGILPQALGGLAGFFEVT